MALGPRDAGGSCIRRARRFLDLASQSLPDSRVKNDLRRMAIVMSVAAVDTYLHAVILGGIGPRGQADPSPALRSLDITLGELVDLADSEADARREGRHSRPRVQAKNVLHRRLLRKTFQSSSQLAEAMSYAGVSKSWSLLSTDLGEPAKTLKARLDGLVHRRNQIVHEGDLQRLVRPQRLKFNDIDHQIVEQDVDWVEELLEALERIRT